MRRRTLAPRSNRKGQKINVSIKVTKQEAPDLEAKRRGDAALNELDGGGGGRPSAHLSLHPHHCIEPLGLRVGVGRV